MVNFKKIAAAASLTGALAGVGMETANSSSASSISGYHTHYAATYGTAASCLANRTGAQASAVRTANMFGNTTRFTYVGGCAYNRYTHRYTYGHITWVNSPRLYYV